MAEQLALIYALQTVMKEHPAHLEGVDADKLLRTISENTVHVRKDGLVGPKTNEEE